MKKVVMITGTSTGFGKLMAITLSKAGHLVVATMRGAAGKNVVAAKELSALPNVDVLEMDVLSEDSVQHAVNQVLSKHGRIDVLVNNAGVTGFGLLEGYSIDQIKNMLDH